MNGEMEAESVRVWQQELGSQAANGHERDVDHTGAGTFSWEWDPMGYISKDRGQWKKTPAEGCWQSELG